MNGLTRDRIMKHSGWIIGLTALLVMAGCNSGEGYHREGYDVYQIDTSAVVDVSGPVGGEAVRNQIGDFFVMELLKKGYSPIERAQVQVLLNEQKFQASDITSSENVAKAGKILNVPVVFFVNIPKFGDEISISAKMVNTEDGSILWMGSGSGKTGKSLSTVLGAVTGAVAGVVVADDDDKAAGAVIGGIAGGAAGNLLAPQTEERVREITKIVCKSLPHR